MLRRNARLRKDYLYRKQLETTEKQIADKKRRLQTAEAAGKPIPTELKAEYQELKKSIELDDAEHNHKNNMNNNHIDDEYSKAGVVDPKILITSSRDPSSRLTQFLKELRLMIPNSQRINRGNTIMKELIESARSADFSDIIIIHEHRGEPDGLIVSHLPFGPTAYFGLKNVTLRHDIRDAELGTVSEQYPHLVFENFQTTLGKRIETILKSLFPVPKTDSRRIVSLVNRNDTLSFRHHLYKKLPGKEIELAEVGPRFEMILYQVKLGTVEMTEAENEWVLRPYMNTAKKRKII